MPLMSQVADAREVAGAVERLAEAVAPIHARGRLALVGIRRRGDVLAGRIAQALGAQRVGAIDITLYRDDLGGMGRQPVVRTTEIDFPVDGLEVLLVDDVIMTGRSVRAALQSLVDLGRPARTWLGVLVDREGRELPIHPDFVGLPGGVDPGPAYRLEVALEPEAAEDGVFARAHEGTAP